MGLVLDFFGIYDAHLSLLCSWSLRRVQYLLIVELVVSGANEKKRMSLYIVCMYLCLGQINKYTVRNGNESATGSDPLDFF